MPRGRSHRVLRDVLPVVLLLFLAAAPARGQTFPYQEELWKDAHIGIYIPGVLDDTLMVAGPSLLGWSDPFPSGPYLITELRLLAMNLEGEELPMLVRVNMGGPPSLGLAQGLAPEPMPAESFFDIFLEIELPTLLPGFFLKNPTPIHALATIEQFPPYFHAYATAPGMIVPLVDQFGDPRGEIRLWSDTTIPWSPPEAYLRVQTCYGTDEAEQDDLGFVPVEGFVSGPDDAIEATFSWRPSLPGAPWMQFAIDADGRDEGARTYFDSGVGDGWTGYFDSALIGPIGQYVDFKVEFQMPAGPALGDTLRRWVTSEPLVPEIISVSPESLMAVKPSEALKALIRLLAHRSLVDSLKFWALPIPIQKSRTLELVDMFALSNGATTKLDSCSCGPVAMASCLKYFAANGHPQLEHPGGDLSKPAQTGRDMACELRGDMGTNTVEGTTDKGMTEGVQKYLKRHGKPGWTSEYKAVDNLSGVAAMLREFEADGEDVMMLLEDPQDPTGKKSHWVTLGSRGSRIYNVVTETYDAMCIQYKLDFMDPAGGGPTSENEYGVGHDAQGRPTVDGYEGFRDGGVPPARIKGYVKVSPPAGGGSGTVFPTAGLSLAPGWILVDAVPARGDGLVDTLTWDTGGFAPGTYLLMVVASSPDGREHSVMRLGGISEYTLDAPGAKPLRSGLRGALPNPTRAGAVIEFALVEAGGVDLTVYDVQGRVVRRLLAGAAYPAGVHRIAWDGQADGGVAVGSSVYFCRFRGGGVTEEDKIVVVR